MAVVLPLIIILTLSASALIWVLFGLPATLGITAGVLEFCQNIFIRCLAYTHFISLITLWFGATLFAGGILFGVFKGLLSLIKAERGIKRLPIKYKERSVVLIDDSRYKAAFTYGLINPRIYISKGLLESIDPRELKGVFLHELHHKRQRDPLKLFFISVLKDSFFYIPLVKHLLFYTRVRKEHEADDRAAAFMREPYSLAGALLKVARHNNGVFFAGTGLDGGPSVSIESRIKRLVEGKDVRVAPPRLKTILASLLVTGFIALSLSAPLGAALPGECSTGHCSEHVDKLGKDCKTHCATSRNKHRIH